MNTNCEINEKRKIYFLLDDEKYIIGVAEFDFPCHIETIYTKEDFIAIFGSKCITDGKHQYLDEQVLKSGGTSRSLGSCLNSEQEILRSLRQEVCFPVINRGKLWYDSLTNSQHQELKQWYQAWLDVTETLKEPNLPEWLKYDEGDK
ncbi:MAG: hypothetical protein FWE22_00780 [Firmicutes bacterium]|nr:hypothetical protein [Bacillota bacterium]